MPPPMTNSRGGMSASANAPLESITRGSSGMPGRRTGSEPTAIMACLNSMEVLAPSMPVTIRVLGEVKWPCPRTTSTLRCLASPSRPLVS